MKANEIQIGDWLYYKGQFNAFPFKVESITKKKVGYHAEPNKHRMYYLRLSECKPIPLTPEILERNGFKLDKEDGWWWLTPKIGITFWVEGDLELEFENKLSSVDIRIKYLHQLQHALRLCGIEKEIILWL